MIIKNGIDIISKDRIKKIYLSKLVNLFIKKILTSEEMSDMPQYDNEKIAFLAKRFSVKESISKAIGCGIQTKNLTFQDITIAKDAFGAPFLMKTEKLSKLIENIYSKKNYEISISISDEKEYAVSSAILIIN